jgi:hypothetical protein
MIANHDPVLGLQFSSADGGDVYGDAENKPQRRGKRQKLDDPSKMKCAATEIWSRAKEGTKSIHTKMKRICDLLDEYHRRYQTEHQLPVGEFVTLTRAAADVNDGDAGLHVATGMLASSTTQQDLEEEQVEQSRVDCLLNELGSILARRQSRAFDRLQQQMTAALTSAATATGTMITPRSSAVCLFASADGSFQLLQHNCGQEEGGLDGPLARVFAAQHGYPTGVNHAAAAETMFPSIAGSAVEDSSQEVHRRKRQRHCLQFQSYSNNDHKMWMGSSAAEGAEAMHMDGM